MIKLEKIYASGFEAAIRGMRNPLDSWDKSDSKYVDNFYSYPGIEPSYHALTYVIGNNDLALAQKLISAGPDHRKFLRQIFVTMDITAPLYWWKEFDTYKVGTVANSCSTMHTITKKQFTLDMFSHEHLKDVFLNSLQCTINDLNQLREFYLRYDEDVNIGETLAMTKKDIWWQIIQLLPSSFNQKRTVSLNYEVLRNIYAVRCHHKLDEWVSFCNALLGLPYATEFITPGCMHEVGEITL